MRFPSNDLCSESIEASICEDCDMHVVGKAVSTNKRSPGMFRSVRLDVTLEAWTLG